MGGVLMKYKKANKAHNGGKRVMVLYDKVLGWYHSTWQLTIDNGKIT